MNGHDYEPQPAKDTAWQRLMLNLGLTRRNKTDERQSDAADMNAAWHEAESDRAARQPGTAEYIAARAAKVLAHFGRGAA